jgi:hypothetical protein
MKTFMTPDDRYRSAARSCRIHSRVFIDGLFPFAAWASVGLWPVGQE